MAEGDTTNAGGEGNQAAGGAASSGAAAAGAAAGAASPGAAAAAGDGKTASEAAGGKAADNSASAAAGDGKAGAAAGDGKTGQGDGKAAAGADAPIDYSTIKMPEGMTADAVFNDAVKIFGENKIAPDVAQKLIDFTADRDKQLVKAVNDGNQAAWTKMRGEWKADTEKNVSEADRGDAKKAAEKLFDKNTAEIIERYGLTDHRGFVEAMVKVGKAIKDDTFVNGNAAGAQARDARSLYPKSNMNP